MSYRHDFPWLWIITFSSLKQSQDCSQVILFLSSRETFAKSNESCPILTECHRSFALYIYLIKQTIDIQVCYGWVSTLEDVTQLSFIHSAITIHVKGLWRSMRRDALIKAKCSETANLGCVFLTSIQKRIFFYNPMPAGIFLGKWPPTRGVWWRK